jgi:hypothetical protein
MKKSSIIILCSIFIIFQSCKKENDKGNVNIESMYKISEKWKQDLLSNKKIYLVENEEKALKDFLENKYDYYPVGLPSYIDASFDDINFDKKKDALFYFYPVDILHGTTGMFKQSDFAILVCTNDNEYNKHDDITEIIENKIISHFKDLNCSSVKIEFDGLRDGFVVGSFTAWLKDDMICCPTYKDIFEYDYSRKNVKIDDDFLVAKTY